MRILSILLLGAILLTASSRQVLPANSAQNTSSITHRLWLATREGQFVATFHADNALDVVALPYEFANELKHLSFIKPIWVNGQLIGSGYDLTLENPEDAEIRQATYLYIYDPAINEFTLLYDDPIFSDAEILAWAEENERRAEESLEIVESMHAREWLVLQGALINQVKLFNLLTNELITIPTGPVSVNAIGENHILLDGLLSPESYLVDIATPTTPILLPNFNWGRMKLVASDNIVIASDFSRRAVELYSPHDNAIHKIYGGGLQAIVSQDGTKIAFRSINTLLEYDVIQDNLTEYNVSVPPRESDGDYPARTHFYHGNDLYQWFIVEDETLTIELRRLHDGVIESSVVYDGAPGEYERLDKDLAILFYTDNFEHEEDNLINIYDETGLAWSSKEQFPDNAVVFDNNWRNFDQQLLSGNQPEIKIYVVEFDAEAEFDFRQPYIVNWRTGTVQRLSFGEYPALEWYMESSPDGVWHLFDVCTTGYIKEFDLIDMCWTDKIVAVNQVTGEVIDLVEGERLAVLDDRISFTHRIHYAWEVMPTSFSSTGTPVK